jgi:hypothetical protein
MKSSEVDVDVPSPLRDCFLHCEVECVRECCGIDAISSDEQRIHAWARSVERSVVATAISQLDALIATVEDCSHNVSSSFLNHHTCHNGARTELLEFLGAFRQGLKSVA